MRTGYSNLFPLGVVNEQMLTGKWNTSFNAGNV
jgi:hypothetical protein